MGVKGLTTFVEEHFQHLFIQQKLQDQTIVLDGNNLLYHLHFTKNIPCLYGGNYIDFAREIVEYFEIFRTCQITPYVVFDGCYEKNDRKLQTLIKRAQDRINACVNDRKRGLVPILAKTIFVETLDSIGVSHVTCNYEADSEIAALAVKWNCPVVSNDSDFFVFDLPGGYIPINKLNMDPLTDETGEKYLHTKVYYHEKFISYFEIKPDMFPLLAALIGNDFTDRDQFETFYTNLPKVKTSKVTEPSKTFMSVMRCLKKFSNIDEAFDYIVSHCKKKHRGRILDALHHSVVIYTELNTDLDTYFKTGQYDSDILDYYGKALPVEYIQLLHSGKLSLDVLNAVTLQRVIHLGQIEDHTKESSYSCSSDIRLKIYAILFADENCEIAKNVSMCEYDRSKTSLVTRTFTVEECEFSIPSLHTMKSWDILQRKHLILSLLGLKNDSFCDFPEEMWLSLASVIYWIKNSTTKIQRCHLYSLILCWMKLSGLDLISAYSENHSFINSNRSSIHHLLAKSEYSKDQIIKANEEITQIVNFYGESDLEKRIVHVFAQWQTIVSAISQLNQVLQYPLHSPCIETMFSGLTVHNITLKLMKITDLDSFVSQLLVPNNCSNLFKKIIKFVIDSAGVSDQQLDSGSKSRRRSGSSSQKNPAKKKAKTSKSVHCQSNRFAMLNITDD